MYKIAHMTDISLDGTMSSTVAELTESERDFRLKVSCEDQQRQRRFDVDVDEEEERRRLDELLTQCHDYIYSCHAAAQTHSAASSKIITNGSLTSRTPSSPHRDVATTTSGVMAACWLELPVSSSSSSSRNEFPFPANDDVLDPPDVTSHGCDDVTSRNDNTVMFGPHRMHSVC